mgnify:CR=1 FL=1
MENLISNPAVLGGFERFQSVAYILAALLFILALAGLSKQKSAKMGNNWGILGMVIALVATLAIGVVAYASDPALAIGLMVCAIVIGGAIGVFKAVRVKMTAMPELVAMLHSFVGAAAVLVGINSFLADPGNGTYDNAFHMGEVGLAVFIGAVTLTGSIGVFGLMFNGEQTLRNKLGITVDVAKTNPSADLGMTVFGAVGVRPLSSAERQFMQNGVERVYETFVGHVAEGRNMSVAAVDSIGGGRVWSGIDAVRIGLVDGFGGLREAIALAADRAGVAGDFRIVTPADELDPLSQVLRMMSAESRAELFKGEFGEIYSQYEMLQNILGTGGVQAIMPYDVRMR